MEEAVGDASSEAEEASVNPAVTPLRMSPKWCRVRDSVVLTWGSSNCLFSLRALLSPRRQLQPPSSSSVEEIPPPESPTRSPSLLHHLRNQVLWQLLRGRKRLSSLPPFTVPSSSSSSSGAAGTAPQSIPMELSSSTEEEGSGGDLNPPPSASPFRSSQAYLEITRPVTQKMSRFGNYPI